MQTRSIKPKDLFPMDRFFPSVAPRTAKALASHLDADGLPKEQVRTTEQKERLAILREVEATKTRPVSTKQAYDALAPQAILKRIASINEDR